jgi:hypothetical protein
LAADLAEEQATSTATTDKIEQEMKEKQQLEIQLSGFKVRCQSLETEKQQLELDLAYSISDVNGDGTPDEFNEESVYKYASSENNAWTIKKTSGCCLFM